jgi:hypothetical protein
MTVLPAAAADLSASDRLEIAAGTVLGAVGTAVTGVLVAVAAGRIDDRAVPFALAGGLAVGEVPAIGLVVAAHRRFTRAVRRYNADADNRGECPLR